MASESAAGNSFLVLTASAERVQDYKQGKPTGAFNWVWDHFSIYDPKYNRKSHAVCNLCFQKNTKDDDGKKIKINTIRPLFIEVVKPGW